MKNKVKKMKDTYKYTTAHQLNILQYRTCPTQVFDGYFDHRKSDVRNRTDSTVYTIITQLIILI